MKHHIAMVAVALAATVLYGAGNALETKPKKAKSTPEERARRRYARTGGFVENRAIMKGNFQIVDCQQRVKDINGQRFAAEYGEMFRCDVRYVQSDAPGIADAAEKVRLLGANVAVFIVDKPDVPALLGAPEERWAMVNVAKLTTEGITNEKLKKRLGREIMRAIGYVCGTDCLGTGAESHPILTPADLEYRMTDGFTVEAMMKVMDYLPKIGVVSYQKTTYKQACEEGWANSPTDEVQKAIWDGVHAVPTKPLKITFDKDKQKPVVK